MNLLAKIIIALIVLAMIGLLILILTTPASAQSITIPQNTWDFTDQRAAVVYLNARDTYMVDTVVNIYVGKSVQWTCWQTSLWDSTAYDSSAAGVVPHPLKIWSADSIRIYTFTVDSITGRGDKRQASLTVSSGFKTTFMLKYTNPSNWTSDIAGNGAGIYYSIDVTVSSKHSILTIWLEKILGDPTKFNGANQLCKLHFRLREEPPQAWVDKYLNGI